MAKRRRRRKTAAKAAPRRRRRRVRRNPGGLALARRTRTNPRRRRRSHRARVARRRYRRNPGTARGLVGGIVQGLKDGGAVVVGEVGARKVRGAVTGMLPASVQSQVGTGVGKIGLSIASALAVSLIVKRVMPGQARMVTAGAFAEAINCALSTTPIAPYLAAYPPVRIPANARALQHANARAALPRAGVSAWPGAGLSAWPMGRTAGMPMGVGV